MRLQLKPALRRAWRGAGTVQIGLDPSRGVLLDGLTAGDAHVIAALDGSYDLTALLSRANGAGVSAERVHQLLSLLREADVLVPARTTRAQLSQLDHGTRERLEPDAAIWSVVHPRAGDGFGVLAGRARRCVAVLGAGRTGAGIATTLAAAGVGQVLVHDDARVRPQDVGAAAHQHDGISLPRQESVRRVISRVAPATSTTSSRGRVRPDLVVLVGHGVIDARRADRLVREDVAHLAVVVRESGVVIGPLVVPGSSPCLRCLDLHRTARDPGWPHLVSQLVARPGGLEPPEESALATAVAGLATLQVLLHLDGLALDGLDEPASVAATLELELPDGLVSRRPWFPHPACGCHWPAVTTEPDSAPAAGR